MCQVSVNMISAYYPDDLVFLQRGKSVSLTPGIAGMHNNLPASKKLLK